MYCVCIVQWLELFSHCIQKGLSATHLIAIQNNIQYICTIHGRLVHSLYMTSVAYLPQRFAPWTVLYISAMDLCTVLHIANGWLLSEGGLICQFVGLLVHICIAWSNTGNSDYCEGWNVLWNQFEMGWNFTGCSSRMLWSCSGWRDHLLPWRRPEHFGWNVDKVFSPL